MKVMILSAGRGERLRPLTDDTPKPLLKAGKYRLIEYLIQSLVKAGFHDIVINTAHLAEQFPQTLGNGQQFSANISYSPEPEASLETAGGIINALPLLGDEPFLIVNGDIWTDFPFEQLNSFSLSTDSLAHLILVTNPEHNLKGDFSLSSGKINQSDKIRYTYSGIGIYHPKLFSNFEVQRLALKPILLKAIEQQQLSGQLYQGIWSDIGTIERLHQLNDQLKR
jgi:N-acetyl-alpha-D-muramate 1-phosphate uridylyltransferase